MQALKLIQDHGFQKAFDLALKNNQHEIAREIKSIEKRMFGTYRNAISMTTQFPICSTPARMDLYNSCPFGCAYCFASHTGKEVIIPASLPKLICDIDKTFNNEKLSGNELSFGTAVRSGWPIHIGGMTDPMPPIEKRKRILYYALRHISKYNHPCVISTKSILPLECNDYVDLFSDMKNNLVFQMSLISSKPLPYLEKRVASPSLRIKTLEKLCNADVNCVIRIQPFMPQLIDEQLKLFEIYKNIGVKAVIVEGLKMKKSLHRNKTRHAIIRTFGIEIDKELTSQRYSKSIYPIETKVKYHRILREAAHQNDLIYLVADNNLRFMGDSPNCCGTDLIVAKNNDCNITNLSYVNPNDFGFHNIRNMNNDCLQLKIKYANFKPKIRTVYETLKHLYNDDNWMFDTYEHMYTDSNDDKHYRIKPEFLT